jgi:hypothetical protein
MDQLAVMAANFAPSFVASGRSVQSSEEYFAELGHEVDVLEVGSDAWFEAYEEIRRQAVEALAWQMVTGGNGTEKQREISRNLKPWYDYS